MTGLTFAGTGSLLAISPLGRRSGAHGNPAVTSAFWLRGTAHRHDLGGYIAAQLLVATLVWQGARFTSTGLNPARSLWSDLLGGHLDVYWVYDPSYPSVFDTAM